MLNMFKKEGAQIVLTELDNGKIEVERCGSDRVIASMLVSALAVILLQYRIPGATNEQLADDARHQLLRCLEEIQK